jgi:hypothetical protein
MKSEGEISLFINYLVLARLYISLEAIFFKGLKIDFQHIGSLTWVLTVMHGQTVFYVIRLG